MPFFKFLIFKLVYALVDEFLQCVAKILWTTYDFLRICKLSQRNQLNSFVLKNILALKFVFDLVFSCLNDFLEGPLFLNNSFVKVILHEFEKRPVRHRYKQVVKLLIGGIVARLWVQRGLLLVHKVKQIKNNKVLILANVGLEI